MEPSAKSRRRISTPLVVLLAVLLLWLLFQPKAIPEVDLTQRRALLEETIRQRDEVPTSAPAPHSLPPAKAIPIAAVELPPPIPQPVQLKQESPPQEAYMDGVQRYLRNLELRHYDDMARRKESFEQRIRTEEKELAGQWEQLANLQAPGPAFVLSDATKRRMAYCIRCHKPRDSQELSDFFARADTFH
jgi:hypothetical protein